jgi:hypothetical protein
MTTTTSLEPAQVDRRSEATLLAHSWIARQKANVWVWSDGWVTKQTGKRKRSFAWRPNCSVDDFIDGNRMSRIIGEKALTPFEG